MRRPRRTRPRRVPSWHQNAVNWPSGSRSSVRLRRPGSDKERAGRRDRRVGTSPFLGSDLPEPPVGFGRDHGATPRAGPPPGRSPPLGGNQDDVGASRVMAGARRLPRPIRSRSRPRPHLCARDHRGAGRLAGRPGETGSGRSCAAAPPGRLLGGGDGGGRSGRTGTTAATGRTRMHAGRRLGRPAPRRIGTSQDQAGTA